MTIELNHTIIWSSVPKVAADFLAEILGRPAPQRFMHFEVVTLDNGVSLDFAQGEDPISNQHYAFLVGDAEFDAIFDRVRSRGLAFWADPARTKPGEINTLFGGRGVYFPDPTGHLLEIITRPYGG